MSKELDSSVENVKMTEAPLNDNQLWTLKPRFHTEVKKDVLWHVDNRRGSRDF
jgi:hypothetical protein